MNSSQTQPVGLVRYGRKRAAVWRLKPFEIAGLKSSNLRSQLDKFGQVAGERLDFNHTYY